MKLTYPAIIVQDNGPRYFRYRVINAQSDWVPWFNIPNPIDYAAGGAIYDSSGIKHTYHPNPRFGDKSTVIKVAENLILPAFFLKLISAFIYFGPKISSSTQLSGDVFKTDILAGLVAYEGEKLRESQLARSVDKSENSRAIVESIKSWVFSTPTESE